MAIYLSHQWDDKVLPVTYTEEELINGCNKYTYYYEVFSYVYKIYGKNYILSLVKDYKLQEKDSPRLYKEVYEYIKSQNKVKY